MKINLPSSVPTTGKQIEIDRTEITATLFNNQTGASASNTSFIFNKPPSVDVKSNE